jgi:stage II sporulation protein D
MKYLFFILIINCSTLFEKSWKTEDKTLFKFIKVNIGFVSANAEVRSSSLIRFSSKGIDKEFSKSYSIIQSEVNGSEKFIFDSNQFELNGKSFRGELSIIYAPKLGKLIYINKVLLEEYLQGVVPYEMPSSWHLEALKSQAIAARTYAVNSIQKNKNEIYHVESTIQSQVYGGISKETKNSNLAVTETKGKILIFSEEPIQAFYHSNSGGQTETAENVWGGRSLAYLKSVRSKYCESATNFTWDLKLTREVLIDKLKAFGISEIESITIKTTTDSGRAKEIEIKDKNEKANTILGNDFRKAIGSTQIKSLLFEVTSVEDNFFFKGTGFGHGVGLSQWGSRGMADAGKSYKDILNHYYTDVSIANID